MKFSSLLSLAAGALLLASCSEQPTTVTYEPTWESLAQYKTPEWYQDAKLGIWAHWGPQCQPEASDWYARNMYFPGNWQYDYHVQHYGDPATFGFKDVIHAWKAEHWNPDSLMALYKRAGAHYFVSLANHHDNMDLWNSKYQEWNSVNVGPHKDILAGWKQAADRQGLPFGISIHASHAWSWYEGSRAYDGLLTKEDGAGLWWEGMDPQHLYCQNHAPSERDNEIGIIHSQWTWGGGVCPPSQEYMQNIYDRTMDAIQTFQPDLVYFDDVVLPFYPINEQLGLDIASGLYNQNGEAVLLGKQLNAEQKKCMTWDVERGVPDVIQPDYWQTCTCLGQWHYDRGTYERGHYKSAAQVIRMLVDIISKNGNMLLSVPLRADGMPDDKELAILNDMASWMEVNGESVFGTRPWTCFGEGPVAENAKPVSGFGFNEGARYSAADIRYVCKGRTVYATVLGRAEGELLMRAFASQEDKPLKVKSVRMLGGDKCRYALTENGLSVTVPATGANDIATVFAVTLR